MFFSKTTLGFYDPLVHGQNIPQDAVGVTREQHAALMDAQASGKRIQADANGAPIAVNPPEPSQAELIAVRLVQVREVREKILNRLGGIAGRAYRGGDAVLVGACDTAVIALLDITANLPETLAEVEAEVTNRYGVIALTAINTAPILASAFASIDL
ncbi:MAG: hypothetical protein A2Z93_06100 [Curvibacter sp. GWA2_64_110]|nr:MAG: hypothetical protein A2Z93_06100 [Curvibacter sp. GWA2_64_110]HCY15628.1 hypothetical protein [Curvibacter sp.]